MASVPILERIQLNVAQIREMSVEVEQAYVKKPFDAIFRSLGEAIFNWLHSVGYESPNSKSVDHAMVYAYCNALELPYIAFDLGDIMSSAQYFESDAWFYEWADQKGLIRMGRGRYILKDVHNRPIMYLAVRKSQTSNIDVEVYGAHHLVMEFYEVARKNVCVDLDMEKQAPYIEVVIENGLGGSKMVLKRGFIENKRTALPEYYPYLEGGLDALIKDFIESDESVLILMGPPGTGKSSAVAAAAESLNLVPIYAKKTEVVLADGFVQFVCQASDALMTKVEGSRAKERSDLFRETLVKERDFVTPEDFGKDENEHDKARVPLIVVEDGDELIAPRSQGSGNRRMAELLNETDGIGSSHTRKLVITTNLTNTKGIDEALMRPGRCYDVVSCRLLTAKEAIAARKAAGLPPFETEPKEDVSLAVALRKPRKKIALSQGKATIGF
jgi:hypothetical protein